MLHYSLVPVFVHTAGVGLSLQTTLPRINTFLLEDQLLQL